MAAKKKAKKKAAAGFEYASSKKGNTVYQKPEVWLPLGAANWVHLAEPRDSFGNNDPKFSIDVRFPDLDAAKDSKLWPRFEAAVNDLVKNAFPKLKKGERINPPFSEKEYEGEDYITFPCKCSESFPPKVFDANREKLDPTMVKFGDRVLVRVQLYACEVGGEKYVRCSLVGVVKVADGEQSVSSKTISEEAFDEIPEEEIEGAVTESVTEGSDEEESVADDEGEEEGQEPNVFG